MESKTQYDTLDWWIEEAEREVRNHLKDKLSEIPDEDLKHLGFENLPEDAKKELSAGECLVLLLRKEVEQDRLLGFDFARPNRPDLPQVLTAPEQLQRLLAIIWADVGFWRLIRSSKPSSKHDVDLSAYLRKRYGVDLELPAAVWMEMANRPVQRQHLFQLMVSTARIWFARAETPPSEDIKKILKILETHLENPTDMRTPLIAAGISKSSLRYFKSHFVEAADDADYAMHHPGVVPAPRGPTLPHRQPSIEKVQIVEAMVRELRGTPKLTDYQLAAKSHTKPDSTWRGYAAEARKLAFLRDQLPVKFHERRRSRRKPSN